MSEERFAGAAFTGGKIVQKKTLCRKGCNITKTKNVSRDNLVSNSYLTDGLAHAIETLVNYFDPNSTVQVLYRCPDNFDWMFQEFVNEIRKDVYTRCIPFSTRETVIMEVERIYETITTVTEHGSYDDFYEALKNENRNFINEIIENPVEIIYSFHEVETHAWLSSEEMKQIHRAILSNNQNLLKKLPSLYSFYNYLERRHAKFGGMTLLHFAVREGLQATVKFLLEKCTQGLPDANGKLPIEYCVTEDTLALFHEAEKTDECQSDYFKAKQRSFDAGKMEAVQKFTEELNEINE